ncbi:hypothetical protein [Deinococcus puniceus]|uniref:Peptidase M50 domain-containing protein n=1 Tax=Deinococcus puniceus TaxID=1182568 RepID=A0A172T9V4_9DEIO|nr:hypothetical protein [Deinococcus puniceus]ANE43799.1 hypothetical protein SU48_08440 [Deinococcus puniceus]
MPPDASIALIFAFVLPISALIHELGHAALPLIATKNHVVIGLGAPSKHRIFTVSFGRLKVEMTPLFFWSGFCAFGPLKPNHLLVALLAGPLISLAALLISGVLYGQAVAGGQRMVWQACMTVFFVQFMITALPITYPNWFDARADSSSDGKQILGLLKERRRERGRLRM